MTHSALLVLEDGTVFRGVSFGAKGCAVGEVVFNTAMTGYQEILTDPSYSKQIVTLTYPHIGNYGCNSEDEESPDIQVQGLVIRDLPLLASNFRSQTSLSDYLTNHGVVGICDIDTRKLTRLLREKGAQNGCIMAGDNLDEEEALRRAREFPGLKGMDLAKEVTCKEKYEWTDGSWTLGSGYKKQNPEDLPYHVVAYDFGVKRNILRLIADRGCRITVVPATTPASEVLAMNPDGVFLSNGPGDPEPCTYAQEAIREILDRGVPVFGICLGHQLLGLASGAKTIKTKFGQHGANQPVQNVFDKTVAITSQNHGFAVDMNDMPDCLEVTHIALFDGTLQGMRRKDKPAFSFQGHPEASPGPHDVAGLFDHFVELIKQYREGQK